MQVSKMTNKEKSIKLAKLCGWDLTPFTGVLYHSLYNPANMEAAWRVLNWATSKARFANDPESYGIIRYVISQSMDKLPEEAQRAWLDKVLELAIEAGMVSELDKKSR